MKPIPIEDLREQLEEFALHLKSGTTKGKHRIGTFDTLELTKLVESLIQTHTRLARTEEIDRLDYTINATHADLGGDFQDIYNLAIKLQKLRLADQLKSKEGEL